MGWQFTNSVEEFAGVAGAYLASDPERHTVALTVVDNVLAGVRWSEDEMHFGWWVDDGQVCGAVFMTPPYPLQLVGVPDIAMTELVDALRARRADVTVVNGERAEADAFARAWTEGTALTVTIDMQQRLYRLEELGADPRPVAGTGRLATDADLELVTQWFTDFHAEAHAEQMAAEVLQENARRRVTERLIWLWEDGGERVAMAARNATAAGVARVGPVYTPPTHRKQGYGTAVTAACTQDALTSGARGAVLFTDLSNPTSNAIYQAIGYRPVVDRVIVKFVHSA
jgi:predicted GNAT family acetyltransferase